MNLKATLQGRIVRLRGQREFIRNNPRVTTKESYENNSRTEGPIAPLDDFKEVSRLQTTVKLLLESLEQQGILKSFIDVTSNHKTITEYLEHAKSGENYFLLYNALQKQFKDSMQQVSIIIF